MAILDNYVFWFLLAIFRLSSGELKFLLYIVKDKGKAIYIRTLNSLDDNLQMANSGRNM